MKKTKQRIQILPAREQIAAAVTRVADPAMRIARP